VPFHVTQRGNRGGNVFFSDQHRALYLAWLCEYAERFTVEVLAYCLMSNHVHLVLVPSATHGLHRGFATSNAIPSSLFFRGGWLVRLAGASRRARTPEYVATTRSGRNTLRLTIVCRGPRARARPTGVGPAAGPSEKNDWGRLSISRRQLSAQRSNSRTATRTEG